MAVIRHLYRAWGRPPEAVRDDRDAVGLSVVRASRVRAWRLKIARMTAVQTTAATGGIQKLVRMPVETTSKITTSEAEMRVCAYWRSNS